MTGEHPSNQKFTFTKVSKAIDWIKDNNDVEEEEKKDPSINDSVKDMDIYRWLKVDVKDSKVVQERAGDL